MGLIDIGPGQTSQSATSRKFNFFPNRAEVRDRIFARFLGNQTRRLTPHL